MNPRSICPARVIPGVSVRTLKRLPRIHKEFDENFLQQLLSDHPDLLPVQEFRDDIGELLCIGREIRVASGFIDNLYLSTEGFPVIVETKLWRNPQARREVLSQSLDYIKEIVQKDFEWFDKTWKDSNKKPLIKALSNLAQEEIDERFFIDRVNRALSRGDVITLIVGDGIETRLQELVSHLCRDTAHLRYSLGLVELACYKDGYDDDGILVVPRIIRQVEPIERAYVRIEAADDIKDKIIVSSEALPTPIKRSPGSRVTLNEEDFLLMVESKAGRQCRDQMESFYTDLMNSFDLELKFRGASVMLKVPHPHGTKTGASVFAFEKNGRVCNTNFFPGSLRKWGIDSKIRADIAGNFWKELHCLNPRFPLKGASHSSSTNFIPLVELTEHLPEIKELIGNAAKAAQNAFK